MTTRQFLDAPRVALDTEFVWMRTYRARLGLVQACPGGSFDVARLHATAPAAIPVPPGDPDAARAVLVDPLAADPAPVGAVVADAATAKILHDAPQDLQHVARWTGAAPENVFDTRVAAGFCGLASTLSLAKLLEETVGVRLPKTETRTDWLRRPLSPEQLVYAAQDVVYLDEAALALVERAEKAGTAAWMMEEMARFDDPALVADEDPAEAVGHVKVPRGAIDRRDFAARARLAALAAWREGEARRRDLPRKWVAADEALVAAALREPRAVADLPPRSISPRLFDSFRRAAGAAFSSPPTAETVERMREEDEKSLARRDARDRATALLDKIGAAAQKRGVDRALVASRAEATDYAVNPDDPSHPLNRGWRRELMAGG